MVEFTTGQYQPEDLFHQHQKMMSYVPASHRVEKDLKDFTRPGYYKLPRDFQRIQGGATYFDNQSYEIVSFSALPDREAFQVLVRKELEFAGDDVEYEDLGDQITIQESSRVGTTTIQKRNYNPDGTVEETTEEVEVKTTFGKAHLAYYDGLSVGGPEYAFKVNGSILLKDVKKGHGWAWGQLVYPQRFDRSALKVGLRNWDLERSVQLQRRDGERNDTFALRKSVLSIQHEFRERLWLDAELWQSSISKPTSNDPNSKWTYSLSLTSLPKTDLSQQFRQLRQVSVPEIQHNGTDVLRISVGARLPQKYRELLKPVVGQITSGESLIQRTALELLESGRVASEAVVFLDATDELVVNAVGSLDGQAITAASLVGLLGGAVIGQEAEIPLPLQYGEWGLPLKSVADLNDSFLRMAAIRAEAPSPTLPKLKDAVRSRGLLLSISGDFSPLLALPAEHPSRDILKRLELFHHLFRFPKISPEVDSANETPEVTKPSIKLEPSQKNFQGILDGFSSDGDWSFRLEVKTDSRSQLKVVVEVGEDLWTYWRCREYMSLKPQNRR